MSELTAGALFSGIGGFCLGLKEVGINTIWAVENDMHSVATYRANMSASNVITINGEPASIKDVSVATLKLPPVDILHAGFPCQSFSTAGDRKGFEDPRGKLFYEIIRIIREFKDKRPSVLLLENAPYLKLGEGGRWFLEIQKEIKNAGYWFRDSNASELNSIEHTSLPQSRNRLFMVAFSTNAFRNGKFFFPEKSKNPPKTLSDYIDFDGSIEDDSYYLDENNKYYQMISREKDLEDRVYQIRKHVVRKKEINICPTLTANMGLGGHNVPFIYDCKGLRRLTEYECLGLQGFPDVFKFPDNVPRAKRYVQVGNSVIPPLITKIGALIKHKIENERLT